MTAKELFDPPSSPWMSGLLRDYCRYFFAANTSHCGSFVPHRVINEMTILSPAIVFADFVCRTVFVCCAA